MAWKWYKPKKKRGLPNVDGLVFRRLSQRRLVGWTTLGKRGTDRVYHDAFFGKYRPYMKLRGYNPLTESLGVNGVPVLKIRPARVRRKGKGLVHSDRLRELYDRCGQSHEWLGEKLGVVREVVKEWRKSKGYLPGPIGAKVEHLLAHPEQWQSLKKKRGYWAQQYGEVRLVNGGRPKR